MVLWVLFWVLNGNYSIMSNLSRFLSHSHKDIDKIRKIRDLFELVNCDPIMFYLKCLDDSTTELEDFIKKEIEVRNVFIYCKSRNAESSKWVQMELDYIRSLERNRIYTIDIENGFENNIVQILVNISNLIKKNSVMIYVADNDFPYAEKLKEQCLKHGYKVNIVNSGDSSVPSMKQIEQWEYEKIKQQWAHYFEHSLVPQFEEICKTGIFVPIISNSFHNGDWGSYMYGKIMHWFDSHPEYDILKTSPDQEIYLFLQQLSSLSSK